MDHNDEGIYLWCKSSCGSIDIEVKVVPGGSFVMGWPLVEVPEEEEEEFDAGPLRASLPENCPMDQRRFIADESGWRAFDPNNDVWEPPDGYGPDSDDDDDLSFEFESWSDQ